MIYTGLNRTGEIEAVKANGGAEVAEVYGGIGESNPIYYKQREMVGTSPMQFKALGLPIKDYRIYGETLQDGTPSPDMPVDVFGCGVRTENLFDGQLQQGFYAYSTGNYTLANTYVCTHLIPCTDNTTYTFRCINTGGGSKNYGYVFFDSSQNRIGSDYIDMLTVGDVVTHTSTTPQNTAFLAINIAYGKRQQSVVRPSDITGFMLNTGSTALPYEPYGYKLPLTINGTEYKIYLGQVPTTRRIKKLVLTGEEPWLLEYTDNFLLNTILVDAQPVQLVVCTHQQSVSTDHKSDTNFENVRISQTKKLNFRTHAIPHNLSDFNAFLTAQYAAGTPVTVWYVLAEPETGIVNEPLHRIGEYADTISFTQAGVTIPTVSGSNTLDMISTVKPSEVSITGNIKPTGYGQLLDVNDVDIQDSNGTPIFIRG